MLREGHQGDQPVLGPNREEVAGPEREKEAEPKGQGRLKARAQVQVWPCRSTARRWAIKGIEQAGRHRLTCKANAWIDTLYLLNFPPSE